MNLMPYECKTRAEGNCQYDCDYIYFGNKMDCYEPLLVDGKPVKTKNYSGRNGNEDCPVRL